MKAEMLPLGGKYIQASDSLDLREGEIYNLFPWYLILLLKIIFQPLMVS